MGRKNRRTTTNIYRGIRVWRKYSPNRKPVSVYKPQQIQHETSQKKDYITYISMFIKYLFRTRRIYLIQYPKVVWRGSLPIVGIILFLITASFVLDHNQMWSACWLLVATTWIWLSIVRVPASSNMVPLFFVCQPVRQWLIDDSVPKRIEWLQPTLRWFVSNVGITGTFSLIVLSEVGVFLVYFRTFGVVALIVPLIYKLVLKFGHKSSW